MTAQNSDAPGPTCEAVDWRADVVILLSHRGAEADGSGGYSGPEVDLLKALP